MLPVVQPPELLFTGYAFADSQMLRYVREYVQRGGITKDMDVGHDWGL